MRTRPRAVITAVLLILLGLVTTATPSQAAYPDWISVTTIEVNRLGGITVTGQVSCQGAYDRLVDGQLRYPDENGDQQQIPWTATDRVYLHANSDNYVVSQPSGRKAMITVEHGSSRMNPCFMQTPTLPDGDSPPPWASCEADGAPCGWVTDAYGHDRDRDGPLFDYSATGKFKTGLMSVKAHSIGLFVWIQHEDGSSDKYFIEEGSYAMTSTAIKAVSYR